MNAGSDRPRDRGAVPSTDARWQETVDLYEVLQVSPRASRDVIQAAYRVLARNAHPDVNPTPDASQRIREINAAYRVLNSPESRARYDLSRARARRSHAALNRDAIPSSSIGAAYSRTRLVPPRATPSVFRHEDRLRFLGGTALLGLLLILTVATIFLLLLWSLLDPAPDPDVTYPSATIHVVRH
jgi:hypothetical protein